MRAQWWIWLTMMETSNKESWERAVCVWMGLDNYITHFWKLFLNCDRMLRVYPYLLFIIMYVFYCENKYDVHKKLPCLLLRTEGFHYTAKHNMHICNYKKHHFSMQSTLVIIQVCSPHLSFNLFKRNIWITFVTFK